MSEVGSAYISLRGESSHLDATLDRTKNRVGVWGIAMGNLVAQAIMGTFHAMTGGVTKLVDIAQHVFEMDAKFKEVFKSESSAAQAWADEFGGAAQRSVNQLKEAASNFQMIFTSMGFNRKEARQMSQTLTELGIDLASFANTSDPKAIHALESGIIGNHRAMRSYGISITQATLNLELMKMGFPRVMQGATEQQKVMARLAIIQRATRDAQGDAIRTASSYANQLKGLQGAAYDVGAALGKALLEPGVAIIGWLREGVAYLSQNKASIQAWGVALGSVARTLVELTTNVGKFFGSLFGWSFEGFSKSVQNGLNAVSAFLVDVQTGFNSIKPMLADAWAWSVKFLGPWARGVGFVLAVTAGFSTLAVVLSPLVGLASMVISALIAPLGLLAGGLYLAAQYLGGWGPLWETIKQGALSVWSVIGGPLTTAVNYIIDQFPVWLQVASDTFASIYQFVVDNMDVWRSWWQDVTDIFWNVYDNVVTIFGQIADFIVGVFEEYIAPSLAVTWDDIVGFVTGALEIIKTLTNDFGLTWSLMVANLKLGWSEFFDAFDSVMDKVKAVFVASWKTMTDSIWTFVSAATDAFVVLIKAGEGIVSGIMAAILALFTGGDPMEAFQLAMEDFKPKQLVTEDMSKVKDKFNKEYKNALDPDRQKESVDTKIARRNRDIANQNMQDGANRAQNARFFDDAFIQMSGDMHDLFAADGLAVQAVAAPVEAGDLFDMTGFEPLAGKEVVKDWDAFGRWADQRNLPPSDNDLPPEEGIGKKGGKADKFSFTGIAEFAKKTQEALSPKEKKTEKAATDTATNTGLLAKNVPKQNALLGNIEKKIGGPAVAG